VKYIAPEELPAEFGGAKEYNHGSWFTMRLVSCLLLAFL